jgi:hypothetical protein
MPLPAGIRRLPLPSSRFSHAPADNEN